MTAREIVEAAMNIAAQICVFTNHELTIEET
jgi:ATP-dependent protease HslVU (ClpYQ) peptidase subunit